MVAFATSDATTRTRAESAGHGRRGSRLFASALALLSFLALAIPVGAAQEEGDTSAPVPPVVCAQPGMNVQCNGFGNISMQGQGEIRGERIHLAATITLHTVYLDREARWVLFSVRNVTEGEPSPVTISLRRFATEYGNLIISEIRDERPGELDLWVHVVDAPVATPITLEVSVGASQRGAFRLETLVMPFDRDYAPIMDQGLPVSLFSFTLLGVNEETGAGPRSESDVTTLLDRVEAVPRVWLAAAAAGVALAGLLVVLLVRRRRR